MLRVQGTVDTLFRRGVFETVIAVTYTLDGNAREYTLAVPIKMAVKPSIATSADVIPIREGSWTTLKLGPGTSSSFRILAVEPSDPYIRWEPIGSGLGEDRSELLLRFRLDCSQFPDPAVVPSGSHWVDFTTSVPSEPRFRLPLTFSDGPEAKAPSGDRPESSHTFLQRSHPRCPRSFALALGLNGSVRK